MAKSITTSIRLDPDLRDQLEHASHVLHRGKNWIIIKALQDYLLNVGTLELAKEARRQSVLAAQLDQEVEGLWEQNQDVSGWE